MNIVFHPRVLSEVDAIMKYYDEVADSKLADEFLQEFRINVLKAAEHPEHFNLREGDFKRVNLTRFPYNFLFREIAGTVRILVVRHHSRNPHYGTK